MNDTSSKLKKIIPFSSEKLIKTLDKYEISYNLYVHKHLFSVEEYKNCQNLIFPSDHNSVHIKNLYLRDKKKKNYLITCEQNKKIDLKLLKEKIKSDRLSFGSTDRLFQNLGVLPGAVSPFCMINGIKNNVNFFCDYDLKNFKKIFLHPFTSNKTVCLDMVDLEKFLSKYHIHINWFYLY